MSTPPSTPPPKLPVNRGFVLGLPMFAVLLIAALLVYVAVGWLGFRGNQQVIMAMCLGPFIGAGVIGVFLAVVKPKVI
jgi:hypothetical protein